MTAFSRPLQQRQHQQGVALVLVLIFSVLLWVVVSQLVVQARFHKRAGENDALLTRMNNHMAEVALPQVEQMLLEDLAAGEAAGLGAGGAEGAGGLGGLGGLGGAGGSGEGSGKEEQEDPTDSSRDSWYHPTAYADGDLTTYVWVEDENRKFCLLALASPDEDFAMESRERLIRLLDGLRENTDHDVSQSDATTIADAIKDWISGRNRNDILPRPKLKSDKATSETSIPLHLDELLLLRGVTEHLFFDKVTLYDNRVVLLPGLESVLTIYTSWAPDPGDPEKQAQAQGNNRNNAASPGSPTNPGAGSGEEAELQPAGEGIRININTVTRPVLRCLFPAGQVSDTVIDAILRYRNEESEEEEAAEGEDTGALSEYSDLVMEGTEKKKQIFKSLEDLEKIPEFENLPDKKLKEDFLNLLTVRSDVFSIHMAAVYKRNEERKVFVLHRRKSVVVRIDSQDEDPRLYPIIHLEKRHGLRIFPLDFPEEEMEEQRYLLDEMDSFTREERAWNPFYLEFYEKREEDQDGR